jgi:hypothetical protein
VAVNAVPNFDLSRAIEVLEELPGIWGGYAMTKRQKPLPPELRDGQYRSWEVEMATRFPLALSEMRWPLVPLHMVETQPLPTTA